MGIKRLSYKDIPRPVRARAATEAQRRLQTTLSDPVATAEQREAARRQQEVLRQWTAGTLTDTSSSEGSSENAPSSDEPIDGGQD